MLSIFVPKDSGIRTYQQYNWAHGLPVGGEWILVIKSIPKPSKFANRSWGLKTCRIRNGQVPGFMTKMHKTCIYLMHGLSESVGDADIKSWQAKCYRHDQASRHQTIIWGLRSCHVCQFCTAPSKKWYKIHKWKKNSKKSVAKLFFTTNHNPTAEVEHRVSRALQNIDLKQNIVFIEAWSTDPIRSTGSAERILDFWISGISTQPGNSQIRILFPNDAKGWKSKKSRLDQLSKHMQQGSLILSFETSEWYYDLPLWLVTV
jgi:hypothetical protein